MIKFGESLTRIAATVSFTICCVSCTHNKRPLPPAPSQVLSGEGWLRSTTDQRNRYVQGYVTVTWGIHEPAGTPTKASCSKISALPLGRRNLVDVPRSRCLSGEEKYSRIRLTQNGIDGLNFYSQQITELYEIHPDARSAPYFLLMSLISDGRTSNAEELYKAQYGKWPNARE